MEKQLLSPSIVIDDGSGYCKAGLSENDDPQVMFPSILGTKGKDVYVADEALQVRGIDSFYHPIERGIIVDFDKMEKIWHHCFFNELRCIPEEYPVLLSETSLNPKENREKTTQIMFETFEVPRFHISTQPFLSLHASGRTTGIVLDSGHGVTQAVSFHEGHPISDSIKKIDLGGQDLNSCMSKLLQEVEGFDYATAPFWREILRDIKEKLPYVVLDWEHRDSEKSPINEYYNLPCGKTISLGSQSSRVPEVLFQPQMCEKELPGIHELVFQSITNSESEIRKELFKNIVLSGGSTLFPGLPERLHKEITGLTQSNVKINIVFPNERKFLPWIGGKILSNLTSFQSLFITKQEYDEYGPAIVHKRCS